MALTDSEQQTPFQAQAPEGVPQEDDMGEVSLSDLLAADWNGGQDAWDFQETPHDNTRRAGFALTGLEAFAERVGGSDEPVEQTLQDFVCDLRHLCDALGIGFENVLDGANNHYSAELAGE